MCCSGEGVRSAVEEKGTEICILRDRRKAGAGNVAPVVGEVFGNNKRGSSSDIVCHAVGMVI